MAIDTTVGGGTAEGYVDSDFVIAYARKHIDRYSTVVSANVTDVIEPAIRRATAFVDGLGTDPASQTSYVWTGMPAVQGQSLVWPRLNAFTIDGVMIDHETIPFKVQNATAEAACWEIVNPNTLHGSITLSDVSKSFRAGPVSESTMGAKTIKEARACLTLVMDYLASILEMPNDGYNFMFMTDSTSRDNVRYQ